MKKLFLILAITLFGLTAKANEVKINQTFTSFEKLDSVKSIINRDNIFITFNLPGYKDKLYFYDSFIKTKNDICTKYEGVIYNFDSSEEFGINVLFYADGTKYMTIKNLNKKGGLVKYNLNS